MRHRHIYLPIVLATVVIAALAVGTALAQPQGSPAEQTICHKPGTPAQKTMTVPQPAAEGHMRHGDTAGPCPNHFQGGVVATFRSGDHTFKAFVTNSQAIDQLFQLQRGESQAKIPNGALRAGPGPGDVNAPWSWHLDPQDFEMAEFTIEVCDGTPDMVEDDLDYWLDTVQRYCPWNAELVSLQDYR